MINDTNIVVNDTVAPVESEEADMSWAELYMWVILVTGCVTWLGQVVV